METLSDQEVNTSKILIEARFECPICLTCLKEPLLTSCGHRFCQDCINEWLKQQDGNCPIDGHHLSITKDLFPDNFTRREIAHQLRHCPVEGCLQVVPLLQIEKHVSDVHKIYNQINGSIACTFHHVGCKVQLQSVQQLDSHLNTDLHHHLALLSSAVGSCKNDGHNLKEQEAQMWEPPSKNNNGYRQNDTLQDLLKSLYERVVLLEQSNREQDIQLTSLRDQVNRLTEENENLKYNLPAELSNGICVWEVDRFQEKYASMAQDPNRCFYSSDFTTSYVGYKFCARIKISVLDPKYLSLLIHLKQGKFDQALDWPFSGRISFTLVHPTLPELSIKETMMSRPELEAFKRPSRDLNTRGFGYSEFILISDIINKGFLSNNTVLIKVHIQTV